jgi:serine/threonine protein kinase
VPGEDFRAKLADFGIAYLVDSTRLTTPGTLVGTAAYLSPEQVRGSAPAPASDIYSLGLILLEALTGERAFPQTATHEAALARLTRDPDIPGSLGQRWKSLLTDMTSRDPAQRPTALDVVIAAGGLATSKPSGDPETRPFSNTSTTALRRTLGLPIATGTLAIPRPKRWHVVVAVAALIVVALIVGALVWALGTSRPAEATVLPTLSDPLATHMHQLLDSVTP